MKNDPQGSGPAGTPHQADALRRLVQLGKYSVQRHIATGGMGAVYLAIDQDLGREVALKILSPELANNTSMLERFRREARAAAKLNHENIVRIFDIGEHQGTHYLALEFVHGKDLHDYINKKGQIEIREACEVVRQALAALNHAHKEGIVHRDIKPSNFLLTTRDDNKTMVVKMTDLGLARQEREDEFRVTKAGLTVGTVDYMSPEQARNSASADIRSDMYSLGCTLFHMLTGVAPYAEGSLTERLYKHIEAPIPGARELNAKVPASLQAYLEKMLAKKPEDRFQTPNEALEAMTKIIRGLTAPSSKNKETSTELTKGSTIVEKVKTPPPPPEELAVPLVPTTSKRKQSGPKPSSNESTKTGEATAGKTKQRAAAQTKTGLADSPKHKGKKQPATALLIGAGLAGVLVLGVVWLLISSLLKGPTTATNPIIASQPNTETVSPPPPTTASIPPTTKPTVETSGIKPPPTSVKPPATTPVKPIPPDPTSWQTLFKPTEPIDPAKKWRELEEPWKNDLPPTENVAKLRVSRTYAFTPPDNKGTTFASLHAAWASFEKLPKEVIVEIHDNGPLFELPLVCADKNVILRAGKDYRPVLVLDLAKLKEKPPAFLSVSQGKLTLENLDIVVKVAEQHLTKAPETLVQIINGDVTARGCGFAYAGSNPTEQHSAFSIRGERARSKVRLSHCLVRGRTLAALDLLSPGCEVLVDRSLLVGGQVPLLKVTGRNDPKTVVRLARSTLVASQSCVLLRASNEGEKKPTLDLQAWDSLLSRCHEDPGGELVSLGAGVGADGLSWQSVNTLYAGWKVLLAGPDPIEVNSWAVWRKRVQAQEGDKAIDDRWPRVFIADPSEKPVQDYALSATSPVGYAASGLEGEPIGCPLSALSLHRDRWQGITLERLPLVATDPLFDDPPEIPAAVGGEYTGEIIEKAKVRDLGEYLLEKQKAGPFGKNVVLRLVGTGDWPTLPIKLKDTNLTLYFHKPEKPELKPLALTVSGRPLEGHTSLIDIEQGNLDIVGGELRAPDKQIPSVPMQLIHVKSGNLRLVHTSLKSLAPGETFFKTLIHFEGSGSEKLDKMHSCSISECQLLSSKGCLLQTKLGARIHLEKSLVLAGTEAFQIDPIDFLKTPTLGLQWSLLQNTISAKNVVFQIKDPGTSLPITEPMLVQAKKNVFLSEWVDEKARPRSGLVQVLSDALPHGLLQWQGEGNVYDRRHFYLISNEGPPERMQGENIWFSLWGSQGDLLSRVEQASTVPIRLDKFDLKLFPSGKDGLGADLTKLLVRP